jgi:hypothetical protein
MHGLPSHTIAAWLVLRYQSWWVRLITTMNLCPCECGDDLIGSIPRRSPDPLVVEIGLCVPPDGGILPPFQIVLDAQLTHLSLEALTISVRSKRAQDYLEHVIHVRASQVSCLPLPSSSDRDSPPHQFVALPASGARSSG